MRGLVRRIDLKKASAARSNPIRDINRQIVLNYVRELGPISRADIAQTVEGPAQVDEELRYLVEVLATV